MSKATAQELYRLYNEENLSQREIGERYGVGQAAVSNWMSKLGVKTDRAGKWSEKEKKILKERYPCPKEEIRDKLPDRTWNAIKLKAMDIGLARDQEEYRKSDEVRERMNKLAENSKIEVSWDEKDQLSYVLGVIDGDGYTDGKRTMGLETKHKAFADKFVLSLKKLGLNPSLGQRRGKVTVWASSSDLETWVRSLDYDNKFGWLREEGDFWKYIEGAYDSDGDFSSSGPRICSYDDEEKEFLNRILTYLGLKNTIQQNNVYVWVEGKDRFFDNVDPVYEKRRP